MKPADSASVHRVEYKVATASVLIVEDETVYLDALGRILDRQGYDVLKAEEPHQALEVIRNTPAIDVVLSDVIMPGMRGTDLVRELAQMSPQTACVLMTGGMIDSADLPQGTPVSESRFPHAIWLPSSRRLSLARLN